VRCTPSVTASIHLDTIHINTPTHIPKMTNRTLYHFTLYFSVRMIYNPLPFRLNIYHYPLLKQGHCVFLSNRSNIQLIIIFLYAFNQLHLYNFLLIFRHNILFLSSLVIYHIYLCVFILSTGVYSAVIFHFTIILHPCQFSWYIVIVNVVDMFTNIINRFTYSH